jgi:hypothetical protein
VSRQGLAMLRIDQAGKGLTKGVDLSAPGDTDVTGDEANPAAGR